MMNTTSAAVLLLGLVSAATASAQTEPPAAPVRPAYQPLRFLEDWSVLARGTPTDADVWDRIKYIPLSDDESVWLSLGGSMRFRAEHWSDFAFGAAGVENDDTFLLWRLLLHADLHLGENVRVFVEGKSALSTDRDLPGGRRTLDVDALDLEQAFIDLKFTLSDDASLTVRPGRQQLLFGKQRLISPLPWSNTQRRWDGVSAALRSGNWTTHGFWAHFVPVQKYDFNDADAQTRLFGVYASKAAGSGTAAHPGVDLYAIGLNRDDSLSVNGTTGREERYTIGGRLFGAIGESGFDFDAEGAYQFGRVGRSDVSAWMFGGEVGYRPKGWGGAPRFWLGVDYGSGDDQPGGDVETFNQLFPLGHAFLGQADILGRQNVLGMSLGVTFTPFTRTKLDVVLHSFHRASRDDAVYNVGGGVLRAAGDSSSRDIGREIDVRLTHQWDRHTQIMVGYSHFFAGDFLDDTGPADDLDFIYAQVQYTF